MFTEQLHKDKLLLFSDDIQLKLLHYATLWDSVLLIGRIWKWNNDQLTADDVNNRLLLAEIKYRLTAWHVAEKSKLELA
jgi:hypothetical protein